MEPREPHRHPGEPPAPLDAEEATALSRALVEGTRDDALIADPDGRIRFISPGLARAAGADPDGLTGAAADRVLSVMQLPSFSHLKAMLTTVSSARTEAELVTERGDRRKVLLRGVSIRLSDGETRYVWFVTPLDRVRTYEWADRLMRSELQTQSRILALVSHELRTPLNIILAQLALLQEGLRGDLTSEQLECVARASRAGQDLLDQVNDLIDLANLESGRVAARTEAVEPGRLAEIVRETARRCFREAPLSWDLVDELPAGGSVALDPDRTGQIIAKLLGNARKFAGEDDASVRITIHPAAAPASAAENGSEEGDGASADDGTGGRYAAVDIRDTGSGIPEEERERVFEPFQQDGDVLSRRAGGSGLGLTIARRLARLQDGELTIESDSPRDTVFRLYLPLSE